MGMTLRRMNRLGWSTKLLPFTDTFDRGDGDLGNGWEYTAGLWTIATNAAKGVPGLGDEKVSNGEFTTGITGWSQLNATLSQVNSAVDPGVVSGGADAGVIKVVDAGSNSRAFQNPVDNLINTWLSVLARAYAPSSNVTSNVASLTCSGGGTMAVTQEDVWQALGFTFYGTLHPTAIRLNVNNGANNDVAYFDSCSIKPIVLADMFCTRNFRSYNVDISVPLTITSGTQSGIVICLDSVASPANFVIATHDGTNAKLTKCVSGTYTSLISAAAAYADGRILRVVKSGNNISLYYNATQIGTTQDVTGDAYVNNTRHGLFSTYSSNTMASFTAV